MERYYFNHIFVLLLLFCPDGLLAQKWEPLQDMPYKRGEHASFIYENNIYVIGGIYNSKYGPYNIEIFDTQQLKWFDKGPWKGHRHHITAQESFTGEKLWVCGGKPGDNSTAIKTVKIYDVKNNSWQDGPDLPRKIYGSPAIIENNHLHIIGGAESNKLTLDTHFVLDLKNIEAGWKEAASLPKAVVHCAGIEFNGEIWIIGGEISHKHIGDRKWVQIYDPKTDSWREGPDLPLARSHLEWSTFKANNKIWSVNGVDSSLPDGFRGQDEIYVYDPKMDKWVLWGKLPHNFTSTGAKIVNGYLYIFGGGKDTWFDGTMTEVWRTPVQ